MPPSSQILVIQNTEYWQGKLDKDQIQTVKVRNKSNVWLLIERIVDIPKNQNNSKRK